MSEPTYQIEKLNFDGPLDLLLQLIEKNKIDIYDIPIVTITEQYMAYVRAMQSEDLEVVSEFLLMAATLLDIKSRELLPSEKKEEEEEEEDPRAELVERLLAYKRTRYIAGELRKEEEYAERFVFRDVELPEELRKYVPPVDLDLLFGGINMDRLRTVYEQVLKRSRESRDAIRSGFGIIKRERVPLAGRIRSLISYAKEHKRFYFRQMLGEKRERTEVVVAFLAVLELMKAGKLRCLQNDYDADIDVEATDEISAEEMDLTDLQDG